MNIFPLIEYPQFIPIIVEWIEAEWPKGKDNRSIEIRLCGERKPGELPQAYVAVSHGVPIGFVSLVYWEKGIDEGRPYWIDAVYVLPSKRGQGLAQKMIGVAESAALALGIDKLFALTDIPNLYKKRNWESLQGVILGSPTEAIMTKILSEGIAKAKRY